MAFIQIVEARTSDVDALRAIDTEWEKATERKRTARRSIVTQDRNDPSRYLFIVFFDSYESAVENSKLPKTQEFAAKWANGRGRADGLPRPRRDRRSRVANSESRSDAELVSV